MIRESLDGRLPDAVYEPDDEAGVADVVRRAAAERTALVPVGGGTAIQTGNTLDAARWACVSTRGLRGVADLSPGDCVATFRAGTTLDEARSALAEDRLVPTFDVPFAERATIGGITACNRQGPLRSAFGAPRDRLLAVRAVLADGSAMKGGGKVVKTVAGYDLCKLLAGSWGTLAVITEATYRVEPEPPVRRALTFSAPDSGTAVEAALAVYSRMLDPTGLAVVGPPWRLLAEVWGNEDLAAWLAREITGATGALGLQEDAPPENETSASPSAPGATGVVRIAALPTCVPAVVARVGAHASRLVIDVRSGIVQAAFDAEGPPGAWLSWLDGLPDGTRVTWPTVPPAWKARLDVWGDTRADLSLMRALKTALDPGRLFSPGRFVGRI